MALHFPIKKMVFGMSLACIGVLLCLPNFVTAQEVDDNILLQQTVVAQEVDDNKPLQQIVVAQEVDDNMLLQQTVAAQGIDGNKLLEQVDKNLSPQSYESYKKLINIEPDGKKKEFILFTIKKGKDKVAALFLSPASEEGRSTLRLGDNMWLYIPNVRKPIRITSLQSVVGGVFNNSDILRLDYATEYKAVQVEKRDNEYLLHLKAKTKGVAYDTLKMWINKDTILPTKIECLTESGMLIKTLYFKNIKNFDGDITRPSVIETDSPLHKGYKSVIMFAKMKKRKFNDEVFTQTFMPNLGSLR